VPKDFIQLFAVTANLLYPERIVPGKKTKLIRKASAKKILESYYPHKYAIQITTDSPQWGGLSGCTFEEATSWGKEDINALKVQLFCDATVALPIIVHALNEKVKKKRSGTDFSYLFENLK